MTPADPSLKSTIGPLSALTPPSEAARLPPGDGADLQSVYDREARYMRRMRDGAAPPLHYVWCPQTSLSLSAREARRLGDLSGFEREPVAIRQTGGTVVPQGPGTLNISILSRHASHPGIRETYQAVCEALMEGFAALGLKTRIGARPGSFCDGDFNILHEGRKLVGTAQRWAMAADGRALCLHHCVVLSGGDPDALCARAEALYRHAGENVRYDRAAHSALHLRADALRAAMDRPLSRFIEAARENT